MTTPRTLYFLDTEFIEDGHTIDLVSIAVVCEDGREYYAVSTEADHSKANDWVRANVLPLLPPRDSSAWKDRATIRREIVEFFAQGAKPRVWGYYCDYDWVALCQLFGRMIDLPKGMPMYCMDLKQWSVELGDPEHPKQIGTAHDALIDARWHQQLHGFLSRLALSRMEPAPVLRWTELQGRWIGRVGQLPWSLEIDPPDRNNPSWIPSVEIGGGYAKCVTFAEAKAWIAQRLRLCGVQFMEES